MGREKGASRQGNVVEDERHEIMTVHCFRRQTLVDQDSAQHMLPKWYPLIVKVLVPKSALDQHALVKQSRRTYIHLAHLCLFFLGDQSRRFDAHIQIILITHGHQIFLFVHHLDLEVVHKAELVSYLIDKVCKFRGWWYHDIPGVVCVYLDSDTFHVRKIRVGYRSSELSSMRSWSYNLKSQRGWRVRIRVSIAIVGSILLCLLVDGRSLKS